MFREMRRKDRQLSKEDTETILRENNYGVVSTIGADGYPYGVPVSYVFCDNKIYFHCALEGHKVDNIRNNSKVSFCVVGKTHLLPEQFSTQYESAIAFGTARLLGESEKTDAMMKIVEKYAADFKEKGAAYINAAKAKLNVVCIEIAHLTGKARRN